MIEINIPNLSNEEILNKIEEELKNRKPITLQSDVKSINHELKSNEVHTSRTNTLYGFAKKIGKLLRKSGLNKFVHFIQKTFKLYPQNCIYVMSDFTKFYDEEFIDNAYKLILNRTADSEGKSNYLSHLRSGKLSKTEIITSLYFSKEGRAQNVIILGIKKRYILSSLYKIPLLGYAAKTLFTIATLPKLLARLNSHENLVHTNFQNLDAEQNALQARIETKSSNETVTNLQNYLESELQAKSSNETVLNLQKQIESELQTKSSNETVTNLQNHLESELQTKSSNEALSELQKQLLQKANLSEFELYLQTVGYAKEYMKISQQNMQNLIDEAKKRLPSKVLNKQELLAITQEEQHMFDTFYVEFEDKFRGTTDDIKARVKSYLPYIKKLPFKKEELSILDVGCGRGEWLELLKENRYTNLKGVDLNSVMVAKSKALGLDVEQIDVIAYLSSQKENSLAAITGFHIIEHLPFDVLMKFFHESFRVLKKGGMVIFETPNPENIAVGACNFYTDPTHLNPIPPITGEFLLQQNSFTNISILRLNLMKEAKYIQDENFSDINDILFAHTKEQDYAIIGYKK
ncbi:MAG: methyltransferase domain-containing protein [Sulfurimonas sp.]